MTRDPHDSDVLAAVNWPFGDRDAADLLMLHKQLSVINGYPGTVTDDALVETADAEIADAAWTLLRYLEAHGVGR